MPTPTLLTRFAAHLSSRGIVRVTGVDSLRFLQSLITADMHALCPNPPGTTSTATGFLDRRGRLLFGGLIHAHSQNDYLIDVPHARIPALLKHLKVFRLRSAVDIQDASPQFAIWQFVGLPSDSLPDGVAPDPRLDALGFRGVLGQAFKPRDSAYVQDEDAYERIRIAKAVPDGRDFETGGLPLDVGLHLVNGVSFDKGCYLGQELTARSHFTGVLRKRLTTLLVAGGDAVGDAGAVHVIDEADVPQYAPLQSENAALCVGDKVFVTGKDKPAGTISSAVDNMGVAVLRMTDAYDETKRLHLQDGRQLLAVRQT